MRLNDILLAYPAITLEEMGNVRLMSRVDTKYVTTLPRLEQLLRRATAAYRVQQIDGQTNMPYYTCYFDTVSCNLFAEHQRGRKARQKIRIRVYENSQTAFFEIKNKNNKGRTDKKRILAEDGKDIMQYADFIRRYSKIAPESLFPQIQNHFKRITLVNNAMTERLTIDTGLCFHNLTTREECKLTGMVIIELKRDRNSVSPIQKLLHDLHIPPCGFSKYCIGMALTNRQLKQNRLKSKLRMIRRMCPELTHEYSGMSDEQIPVYFH